MRDGLRAMLAAGGHTVVGEADGPAQAQSDLARLEADIVLLDLGLHEHSGFELLAELQQRRLPARVIVLTMSTQGRDVAEAMRLGAAGYLAKLAPSAVLLDAIDRVGRGERVLGAGFEAAAAAPDPAAATGPAELLQRLSARERQILALVVRGRTSASIALQIGLSPKTVETYRSRLMDKLEVPDVTGLVRFAIRAGLIDADLN